MAEEKNQEPLDDGEKEENVNLDNDGIEKENAEKTGEALTEGTGDNITEETGDKLIEGTGDKLAEGTGNGIIEEREVDDSDIQEALDTGMISQETNTKETKSEGQIDFELDEDEVLDELPVAKEGQKGKGPDDGKRNLVKNQIEAVLFVSGQAVSAEEINVKLGISKKIIEELLEMLAMEYLDRSTCLEIAKVADKYILQLKPEFTSSVKSFAAGGLIREAVMRTLTIIAAKQPIVQSELSKLRSSAGEHIKELLDLGLVRATPKGRSRELVTTDKFADMFGFSRDIKTMKEQIKIYLTAATQGDDE